MRKHRQPVEICGPSSPGAQAGGSALLHPKPSSLFRGIKQLQGLAVLSEVTAEEQGGL